MATATEKPAARTRPAPTRQPAFDQFLQLLEEGDADDMADALLHLDEQRRRALVPRIRATDPAAAPGSAGAARRRRPVPGALAEPGSHPLPGAGLDPSTGLGSGGGVGSRTSAGLSGGGMGSRTSASLGTGSGMGSRTSAGLGTGSGMGSRTGTSTSTGLGTGAGGESGTGPASGALPADHGDGAPAGRLRRGAKPDPDDRVRREGALLVAGAGCLPTGDDVVAWLRSPRFKGELPARTIAAVIRVLQAPGRPGLATVATDLAAQLKHRDHDRGEWALTAAALRAAGLPLPATEPMLRGWVRQFSAAGSAGALAARLAEDPWLETQLPALFATPKVAADLDDLWPAALALLAAGKRIDRRQLIALLVGRLRSGDRGAALRPVLETFRHLDPTLDERAAHRADFLAMLAEPNGPVAELAQRVLRALDDAGHLDADTVAAATRAAFARTEKKLIRAQFAWLDRAIARHPDAAPSLLEAATSVLNSDDPEVAERALRVVGHHSAGPEALRPAAGSLAGDLRRQADEIIGQPSIPPGPRFPPSPSVYVPEPMPPAIGSLPELTATLAHTPLSPLDLERVLAAVAKFAVTARPDLAWALAPLAADRTSPLAELIETLVPPELAEAAATRPTAGTPTRRYAPLGARPAGSRRSAAPTGPGPAPSTGDPAGRAATLPARSPAIATSGPASAQPATTTGPTPGPAATAAGRSAGPAADASGPAGPRSASAARRPLPPPQEMLRLRIHELAGQLGRGEGPPALLATPATRDGHVDPARLLLRLASAERAGWQPGPYDLAQALLRLPRETPPSVLTAAARLNSTAGRRFAAWLRAGGLPDPAITMVGPPTGPAERTVTFAPLDASGLALPPGLLAVPAGRAHATPGDQSFWPLVLPSHREIIAAHVLHSRRSGSAGALHEAGVALAQHSGGGSSSPAAAEKPQEAAEKPEGAAGSADVHSGVLSALARSSGPFGPAMALALAQALTTGSESDRRDAVTAVAHLARCGGLDAGLLGRELALLLAAHHDDLHAAADALADLARGGAQHAVWAVLHAVLPALLRLERPPAGLPDLLALASAVAAAIGARAHLPEVSAAAALPERTRLKNEAARLARTLA
ncbi:hypothetical protein ACGFJ7_10885 [Actinoplanes sp. NPDC048988]|uniref:hypothetical protein n=1 Tax=Actinoplanes sp. NPDC048988 TaxID=3363901 RepID=UPI00370FEDE5